jgi:hypothetical protein
VDFSNFRHHGCREIFYIDSGTFDPVSSYIEKQMAGFHKRLRGDRSY